VDRPNPWDEAHLDAIRRGADSYRDPETGYTVFTAAFLHDRGDCCNTGCRHCPYGDRGPAG
jgi:hypothetical protein